MSFNWPFLARPIAVRFAKVTTTSSAFLSNMADRPREDVDAARTSVRRVRTAEFATLRDCLANMTVLGKQRCGDDVGLIIVSGTVSGVVVPTVPFSSAHSGDEHGRTEQERYARLMRDALRIASITS